MYVERNERLVPALSCSCSAAMMFPVPLPVKQVRNLLETVDANI